MLISYTFLSFFLSLGVPTPDLGVLKALAPIPPFDSGRPWRTRILSTIYSSLVLSEYPL
jgi:hypothetical protein